MANHKSAIKRIRSNAAKRALNRYQHKTVRNAIKNLRNEEVKATAVTAFPKVASMIAKLAKRNVIHKNKAGNLISQLAKRVNVLK